MRKYLPILAIALLAVLALWPSKSLQAQTSGHSTTLTWTPSASAASCVSPCTFGYVVLRGTAAGAESLQLNSTPIAATTYVDPITLTANPQTFYYVIQAVETSGGITVNSGNSNEVSVTFPGIPSAPSGVVATPK